MDECMLKDSLGIQMSTTEIRESIEREETGGSISDTWTEEMRMADVLAMLEAEREYEETHLDTFFQESLLERFGIIESANEGVSLLKQLAAEGWSVDNTGKCTTHTYAIAEALKTLGMVTRFETVSEGLGDRRVNCYLSMKNNGGFVCTRFGQSEVSPIWRKSGSQYMVCEF